MADTLFRDELLESGRWLDLPTDTDRLAFFGLRMRADDFGNLEAGLRKLFRFFNRFTQIKTEEVCAVTLAHLVDADLVRGYVAEEREFYHLPRCRTPKSYLVRKCPPSPWCNPDEQLGKHIRKITKQGLAKNLPVTSQKDNKHVLLGVGVGVGVGVKNKSSSAPVPVDKSVGKTWAQHWKAKGKSLGIEAKPGESEKHYCERITAIVKG